MEDLFEVGKYYKWIGPKERPDKWNNDGFMDFILDGKPRKCIATSGINIACFEGQPEGNKNFIDYTYRNWHWAEAERYMVEASKEDDNGNLMFDFD